ncbi:MAG: DNA topoisomerase III [Gammaproteobacteria bacterium]|nr:DNA topoisomerase III [Gammaproteobacteria bacterium]MCP5135439.1 DNA topoisomerase III [Gammaproteobacteria bacterium]
MTRIYICEKPSQARDLAQVLGFTRRGDGYIDGGDQMVTWALGHLLEMQTPDAYDERYKRWELGDLPIAPDDWKLGVTSRGRGQFKVIKTLLGKASSVVIATDADREGEMIARELLDQCRWHGPVTRLWLTALDSASIKNALASIRPGSATESLYQAALGRARADWLIGMNLTRLYTLLARRAGHDALFPVGRVQTPTLRLVVERDRAIEDFTPAPYWVLAVQFSTPRGPLTARWIAPEAVTDDEDRCVNEAAAQAVVAALSATPRPVGEIFQADTSRKRTPPPLPFSLSDLQQYCNAKLGLGADQVLSIAQALYETHKATTYPRSDCSYLPESQLGDAPDVLAAMARSDAALVDLVDDADAGHRSRAWNDKKVTAHHAIIPTAATVDMGKLSADEAAVYDMIRRRYLAQFYPDYEFDETVVRIECAASFFGVTGRVPRVTGWRVVLGDDDDVAGEVQTLPPVQAGDEALPGHAEIERKLTRPPAPFTEGTLIAAMKNAARFVDDPDLQKRLRDSSGIGTEATRASIIANLVQRGLLVKAKKALKSTPNGRTLVDAVPSPVSDPATTAIWEEMLAQIERGEMTLDQFMDQQLRTLQALVGQAGAVAIAAAPAAAQHACPECGKPMQRRKSSKGFFWGCTDYPDCKTTLPDLKGKPGKRSAAPGAASGGDAPTPGRAGETCPSCGNGKLVLRSTKGGNSPGSPFLGCSRFPECKHFEWVKA